jgi:hypothetical protein
LSALNRENNKFGQRNFDASVAIDNFPERE